MPVKKFRSLQDAQEALWMDPRDPTHLRKLAALWRLARALAPRRYPSGVHRYRSIGEANLARDEWERVAMPKSR